MAVSRYSLVRTLWMVLGFVFVGIGILGFILPGMPGLVFFLIATFCFAQGSRKFLRMLISNPYVGPQILDFKRGRGMTVQTKMIAIAMLLTGVIISVFFMVEKMWVKYAISFTAAGVVLLIVFWKTKKNETVD